MLISRDASELSCESECNSKKLIYLFYLLITLCLWMFMANMGDRARVAAARVTPVVTPARVKTIDAPLSRRRPRKPRDPLLLFPLNVGNWVSAKKNSRLTKVVSGHRRVAFAHSLPEKEHRRARFLDFSTSSSQAPSVGDRGDDAPRSTKCPE